MNRQIKDYLYFALLIVFTIFAAKLTGQTALVLDDDFLATADALAQKKVDQKAFVGVVAGISINGNIDWSTAKGYNNIKAKKAIDTKAIFRTASIAKSMTAVAIMQLVEQGLIDLDAPIQQYLPEYPVKKAGTITTRQLLSHTAGIPGYASAKEAQTTTHYPTLSDAVNVFKNRALEHTPGTTFSYATYGYVVLGLIIEKVSGLSYEAYMTKNIWEKAGMKNTGVEKINAPKANTSFYHKNRKGKISLVKKINDLSNRIPGGGFYSTMEDLLRFGDAILNNKLIQPATLAMMLEKSRVEKIGNPYSFGWAMYGGVSKPAAVFGHNGEQTGVAAQLMIIPDKKATVVVLSNTSGAGTDAIIFSVELIRQMNELVANTGE